MARESLSQRILAIVKSTAANGVRFAVAGTVVGALGGALGGVIYEYSTGTSGGNGPLLFLLTAQIGCLFGIIYGGWKEES